MSGMLTKLMDDGTGQPVVIPQREVRPQQFFIGNDEAELELSVETRSFLRRVNDQVRKRQKSISYKWYGRRRKTFYDLETSSVTMESAVFTGKNYQNNCHSIANTKDLTLKQMFDISAKLVAEKDEISGMGTINWLGESFIHGNTCHQLVMKESSSSTHKGLRLFRFWIVSWKDSSTSKCQRKSTASQWNSS